MFIYNNPKKILIQELIKSQRLFNKLAQTLNSASVENSLMQKSIDDIEKLIEYINNLDIQELQQLLEEKSKMTSSQDIMQMRTILEQFVDKSTILYNQTNIEDTYLDAIKIKNYFSIKDIEIEDLKDNKEIYFVGENGDGKTILLQSIVLALKEDNYPVLAHEYIEPIKHKIELFTKDKNSLSYKDNKNVKNLFAYGINRNKVSDEYPDKSGCSGLFDTPNPNHTTLLRKPQLLLEQKSPIVDSFIEELKNIIGNRLEIVQTKDGIRFKESSGDFIPFRMLSEGYKTTLIWLSDLLSRMMENQPKVKELSKFKAIVLIDEVDLYLHPKWKYDFMYKLRNIFPNIQFIVTTHSLVTILGASEDAVFYKVYKDKGQTKVTRQIDDISSYTSNILLTSPIFNLGSMKARGFKKDERLSSDDFIYREIHVAIKEHMKNNPSALDDELKKRVKVELKDRLARLRKK